MNKLFSPATVLLFLLGLALGGCSPEVKKTRYLEQADQSFKNGRYDEAEINYKNALKLDGQNPSAIGQLGLIYADQGRIGQAIPLVLRGSELQPENLELRLKLAQLNLTIGNSRDVQAEATYVLERRPTDETAPLLLSASVTKAADIAGVRTRLESLPPPANTSPAVLTALGELENRQNNQKAAEALFQQALAANPKFAPAHASLGSLYWFQNKKTEAENAFRLAADNSALRSNRRLQYAQFKIQTGDPAAGKRYLEEMTRNAPDYLAPWTMLAELALLEKDFKACAGFLDKIAARDVRQLEGMFLRGRLELAQGNTAKAIEELERLLKIYPRAAQAHYQLGLAHLAAGNASPAASSLRQTLTLVPGQADATLALANLQLRTGDPAAATALLKPLIQQQPRLPQARLLLAEAFRQQKNFDEAIKIYRQLEIDFPGNAQTPLLTGLAHLQQNQPTEARRAFNQALERSPGLVPALERLTALDASEKKLDEALRRVEAEVARSPDATGVRNLLAKICIMKKDTARAMDELRKTLDLQPENSEACYLLAQLYLQSNEDQKALANLQTVIGQTPGNVGAWLLIAQIHEQRKDYAAARDAYEKTIALNPRLGSAHNNLAYLYSEYLNEPEKALAAAQKARELMPQEPHTADTQAWILFKKGQYRWALSLLEDSAAKLPHSPVVQHHLGMARYMLGQEDPARIAFQHALDLNQDFPAIEETRLRLALLNLDPTNPTPAAHALLDKVLADRPGDPVALARLAAMQGREGAHAKAIATLQKAVAANPDTVAPLINLARAHALNKDTAKALDTAKAARKIDPDDPGTTHTLGQIAFQAGDHAWAAGLLQEAAQKITDDPTLFHEAGLALYSIGRVAEAESALQAAVDLANTKPLDLQPSESRGFLEMIAFAKAPSPTAATRIQETLANDPDNVPALMAQGTLAEKQGDLAAAHDAFTKAIARFPEFTPAKIRIAVLAAAQPGFDAKACELALQARNAAPDDTELARALGILMQRKGGEGIRAVSLLKQAAVTRPNDAELLYNLGLAQIQAKDAAGARLSLQKALDAGLRSDLATEARKTLAGLK